MKTTNQTEAAKYSKTIAKALRLLGRAGLTEESKALLAVAQQRYGAMVGR